MTRIKWAAVFLAILSIASLGFAGCKKSPEAGETQNGTREFHLHGKIVSIDQPNASLMIAGDEIPGFMSAMTMPYPVHNTGDLTKVGPGDEITCDVIVPEDGPAYIQNVTVVKKGTGAPPASTSTERDPQPGDAVPDFALIDQDGKRIHLSQYRGETLLITFIYTRCPFPDFCPLVSRNFAQIYASTRSNPALSSRMRLLSVSFDPDNDTPATLRKYAHTFDTTTGGNPFARWDFAVVPKSDLAKVTGFFGVTVGDNNGQVVHSMSTSVITPDGKIYSWHDDTDWKPADLIADATAALAPAGEQTAADLRNAGHAISTPATATN